MVQQGFPRDFLWGAATSSYQIEGAVEQDGRGPSIWDTFAHTEGKVADKSDGDVACDHYHLWEKDIQIMQNLSLQAYRFSVSWSRIFPDGNGQLKPNQKGLDFYSNLVDGLLAANIEPWLTLYHWDLPQALQDKGGWTNRDVVSAFEDYAFTMADHLGDRVKNWITHNEPWCVSVLGHLTGEHAPGWKNHEAMLQSAHHTLLSHGKAVPIIRQAVNDAHVGITLNLMPIYAASESEATKNEERILDGSFNRWYLDPVFKGQYPEDMVAHYKRKGLPGSQLEFIKPGDLDAMKVDIDFLGVNYYTRLIASHKSDSEKKISSESSDFTDMGWEVFPPGMRDILARVHKDYAPKSIYITENGAAYSTGPDGSDHHIPDEKRIQYLESHISACKEAIELGVPLRGYFAWSLLDNFEWAHGYKKRFGMVWVDYGTLERTPKESALWYKGLIEGHTQSTC